MMPMLTLGNEDQHMPSRKINVVEWADRTITKVFDPHIAGDVNDSQGCR